MQPHAQMTGGRRRPSNPRTEATMTLSTIELRTAQRAQRRRLAALALACTYAGFLLHGVQALLDTGGAW